MTKKSKKGQKPLVKTKRKITNMSEFQDWFKKKGSALLLNILRYILIVCIGYIIILPLLEMISTAFMSPEEVGSPVSEWVPSEFSVEHVVVAFYLLDYVESVWYTLYTTAAQVVLQVFSAAISGYAFARVRSKKIQALFIVVILTIVVPQSVLMIPQYILFADFDLFGIIGAVTGTGKGISLLKQPVVLYLLDFCGMGLKSGLYIYIFRQFFRGLPKELEESAHMDGCGFIRTLFAIVMPNAVPGIITVSVLSFVWNWNDTYYTARFVGDTRNLMVGLGAASSAMDQFLNRVSRKIPTDYYFTTNDPMYQASILTTASLLVILPLIVLYSFIQKKFVESASNSGIVG